MFLAAALCDTAGIVEAISIIEAFRRLRAYKGSRRKERSGVVSRTARESKAEVTHIAAMKIIAAERTQLELKAARLRKLRLARETGKNEKPQLAK